MATNYLELVDEVGDWLNRVDLAEQIPILISDAEARFRRELRKWLKVTLPITNVTGDYDLPADVDTVIGVAYNDGAGGTYNHALDLLTREQYQLLMSRDSSVRGPAWAVYVERDEDVPSTKLRFYPPASAASPIAALRLVYIKVLPSLGVSQPSNALLRAAPDVYKYGALAEAAPYLQHDERLPVWEGKVEKGIADLEKQAEARSFGGTPRHVRLPVSF